MDWCEMRYVKGQKHLNNNANSVTSHTHPYSHSTLLSPIRFDLHSYSLSTFLGIDNNLFEYTHR